MSSTSLAFSLFLSSVALLLDFSVIFNSADVNLLPGFYDNFICSSLELFQVPIFFYILSFYLP